MQGAMLAIQQGPLGSGQWLPGSSPHLVPEVRAVQVGQAMAVLTPGSRRTSFGANGKAIAREASNGLGTSGWQPNNVI